MKVYEPSQIKNIVLLGHSGSGKTTLAESMLFEGGEINRRGNVRDKNTISDFNDLEHERGNSVFSTLLFSEWRGYKINILDTPGSDDFIGDVISSLSVCDTGIMCLNANYGVEVGAELLWEYTDEMNKPIIFAVNHVDGENADFDKTVEQAKNIFGSKVTVVQYPLNQGIGFNAIIDVLKMTMYKFGADGGKPEKLPIPDSEKEKANKLHNELVEMVAQEDEKLMDIYFEKGELTEDQMRQGMGLAMIKRDIYPLFCTCASKNMGAGRLMGFIDNVVPSAADMPPAKIEGGGELKCDPKGSTVLFIFKTISDAHLGEMSLFKVCSGEVSNGIDLINAQTQATERLNSIFTMQGKKRDQVEKLMAGDIGATVKLKQTHTNNTLHVKGHRVVIDPIKFPEPRMRVAILSKNKGDEEKMAAALHHITEEDPTVIVQHSQELKQIILGAQGELHINMVKWKLENLFKQQIAFEKPRIPYRETIRKQSHAAYRHKKQSGGAGQFGEVSLFVEPFYEGMPKPADLSVRGEEVHELKWGGKLVFLNCVVGGVIDTKYMSAIQKGIMEKMENGPLTGSYVRDVRVAVYDGKMHAVDSNDMAFRIAGTMAFKEAFHNADPQVLEPIYNLEVTMPDEMMGDVISDLNTRRSMIIGMDSAGHNQVIKAQIPLAELNNYSSMLRSITQGRAKYKISFHEYAPLPFDQQQKLVAEHQKELQEA